MRQRKKLSEDVSISELLQLRKEGLTNKEIAEQLDVSPSTIYRYIGKRSMAVRKAAEQNKPCPIPETAREHDTEEIMTENHACETPAPQPILRLISESVVKDLQGSMCVFHINTGTQTVEMKDDNNGQIVGMMSASDIPLFIEELRFIHQQLSQQNKWKSA